MCRNGNMSITKDKHSPRGKEDKAMTSRFQQELSGSLGEYWKAAAEKEIEKMSQRALDGEIFFGADGVCRWKSNNRILPTECRQKLAYTPYRDLFNEEACRAAEEKETAEALEAYRRSRRETTLEERMEMQAAFGKGYGYEKKGTGGADGSHQ
ncbi:MAG: hypothetical protein IJ058_14255 [Lachnospiraceae bacterium]|nr:hypothetical protein [Lachnospiraceae bacterium]MBQ8947943.1 hypothetical protein [Lachnospiraceae bacterium]